MSTKTDNFIKTMALLARNEYMSRDKWILPSVCIAQGALESGWNLKAKSVFGIKGTGFKATTSEYYNGVKTEIVDSFRTYPDLASAVVGYYDFLANTPRYAKAINNTDYKDAVDKLIHTVDGAPYATDPNYISKIIGIIETYNLTQYDVRDTDSKTEVKKEKKKKKANKTIANEVLAGKWGNGAERKKKLTQAGYDYEKIQKLVNELVSRNDAPISKEITHTVKAGESLWSISKKYLGVGGRFNEIKKANGLTNNTIYVGQELKIPKV